MNLLFSLLDDNHLNEINDTNILKEIVKNLKMIIDYSEHEIAVMNAQGFTVYLNPASERHYGMKVGNLIQKNVVELEKEGIFFPSITPLVLEKKRKITILQETLIGRKTQITGVPVLNVKGEIIFVVCNASDVTKDFVVQTTSIKRADISVPELSGAKKKNINFIFQNDRMKSIYNLSKKIGKVESTVLLLGESGVGKDVLARTIHYNSSRSERPFIKVNCGAMPVTIIESELFGYERGSFTGAIKEGKIGLIEAAHKGTIFLDEVAEIPIEIQPKFLQVLQEKQFTRVGGTIPVNVDIRIISATNKNLMQMVENGSFREDLYYRLNVVPIEIPPLRKRQEDFIPLINYFINYFNDKYEQDKYFTREAVDILCKYQWPGNIRELENVIERLVVTVDDQKISPKELPLFITKNTAFPQGNINSLEQIVEKVKAKTVKEAYEAFGSSYKVGENLGVSQRTAARLINKYVHKVNDI